MAAHGPSVTNHRFKPLRFATLPTGCFIPVSHKVNQDGYFRYKTDSGLVMFHRLVLLIRGVEIPEGREVDHLCNNRGCCNPSHLVVRTRTEHLVSTNTSRYAFRKEAARQYWLASRCTGKVLAERYGVRVETGCKWIRQFRRELINREDTTK